MRAVANLSFGTLYTRQSGIPGTPPAFNQSGAPMTIAATTGASSVGIELVGITDAGSAVQPSLALTPLIKT